MKKLVTALIIVLPIIFVVAIFAVTNIAGVSVGVHATGIVISNKGDDGVFTFDILKGNSPMDEWELGVEVQPLAATNRHYALSITDAVSGEPTDIVTIDSGGSFHLHDVGVAKLTYISDDGGYSDSVLFNILSCGVLDFTPVIVDMNGQEYTVQSGTDTNYAVTLPSGAYQLESKYHPTGSVTADVLYTSSNSSVLSINPVSGKFDAILSGSTVIEMSVDNLPSKTIAVDVEMSADVTINGIDAAAHPVISCGLNSTHFSFFVESRTPILAEDISIDGENVETTEISAISPHNALPTTSPTNTFLAEIHFYAPISEETIKEYTLNVNDEEFGFSLKFLPYSFNICSAISTSPSEDIYLLNGEIARLSITSEPINSLLRYEWHISDSTVAEIAEQKNGVCTLKAVGEGEAKVIVKYLAQDGINTLEGEITYTVMIVNGVGSMLFKESGIGHGLGELAIASNRYSDDGGQVTNTYITGFSVYGKGDTPAPALSDFEFSISDPNIADIGIDNRGVYINVRGTGKVTLQANWKYGDKFNLSPIYFTFNAVDGVAVSEYGSLKQAMKENKAAVIDKDIYLGENLFSVDRNGSRTPKYDAQTMKSKLLEYTEELKTTWDWTYYKNTGRAQPTVRYCLEFTADVYGNGHTVSGEYITNMLYTPSTPYSFAVFTGPLDFVAASTGGSQLAAVKGQDNIVFLNRTDGIRLDNVVLKGCDDSSLYEEENGKLGLNLSLLGNVGTTLEIMADTVITNSRIMNGRTCVRAFGKYGVDESIAVNANEERIHLMIDGCVLQNAREFLLKIGTNRTLKGNAQNPSPSLCNKNGEEYSNHNSPACDRYINDNYFMSNLVLTEVTLKDSTLKTSGLLSIGIESHFAGEWLSGGAKSVFDGWTGLAATSYPALLRLVGNVKLDDWKELSGVDSSTLIETDSNASGLGLLSLNIAEMLKCVRKFGGDAFKNIIADVNGKSYVHGGIALYGGGKNYSIVDLSEYTSLQMTEYNINLSVLSRSDSASLKLQGKLLPLAAGNENFRFIMLDSTKYKQ